MSLNHLFILFLNSNVGPVVEPVLYTGNNILTKMDYVIINVEKFGADLTTAFVLVDLTTSFSGSTGI